MRDNLIFYGIPEENNVPRDSMWSVPASESNEMETAASHQQPNFEPQRTRFVEDCESKVHIFLEKVLKVDNSRSKVRIDRAHRIKSTHPNRDKPRPIVVKFLDTASKMLVKDQLRSMKLRDSPYNVSEQFPPEVQQRRRDLIPVMIQARKDGKRANLVRDKLYIDNREYIPPIDKN